ncbi:MAG: hypothetical protein KGL73_01985 [Burkholderiales bacterium]|nr:hypothetical protein [Burkholderiales bacterium]
MSAHDTRCAGMISRLRRIDDAGCARMTFFMAPAAPSLKSRSDKVIPAQRVSSHTGGQA